MKRLATLLSVLLLAMAWTMINADEAHAQEVTLASWDFEDQNLVVDDGIEANEDAEMSATGVDTLSWVQGSGGSGTYAANYNGWHNGGGFWSTIISTEGYVSIQISSKQFGSNTGPRDFQLQYRTSAEGFWIDIPNGDITVANNWTSGVVNQLPLPSGAADQETLHIRWLNTSGTAINGTPVAAAGTNRIADIVVTGIPTGELTPIVAFGASSDTVIEGQPVEIPVVLSFGDGPVSVEITTDNPGAFEDSFPQLVEFDGDVPGSEEQSFTVTALATAGGQTAIFTFSSIPSGVEEGEPSSFELTIEDVPPPLPTDLIAYWNFNVGTPGDNEAWSLPINANLGSGQITSNFAPANTVTSFAGSSINALNDDEAGGSLSVVGEDNNGNWVQFEFGATRYENIQISWAGRGTGTGFGSDNDPNTVQYSTDGGDTFTNLTTYTSRQTSFARYEINFAGTLDGVAEAVIRIVFDGATSTSGNNRIDNVQILGDLTPGSVSITGGAGWRMLSSMTDGATVQDLANVNVVHGIPGEYEDTDDTNLFIGYDGDPANQEGSTIGWVEATGLSHILEPGKGFIWYLYHDEYEDGYEPYEDENSISVHRHLPMVLTYTGSLVENHSVIFLNSERAEEDDGFYLIGNPYAEGYDVSGISAGAFDADLGTTFSHYDPEIENYRELMDDPFNGVAPVGAGFFVQFTDAPETDVTFTFGPPVAGRSDAEVHFARFQLSGELMVVYEGTEYPMNVLDRNARAVFSHDATDGRDRYDATKLNPLTEYWAGIAMIGVQGEETIRRAAESRPMPLEAVTLPMALTTHTVGDLEAGGTFTIELVTDALGSGWEVSLRDLETGQTVNMLTDSYTFTLPVQPAIAADERFELTFTPPTVSGDDGGESLAFGLEALWPNPTHGTTRVAFTLPQAQDVTLDVFDVLGRRVMQIANDEYGSGRHVLPMSTSALASGVYVVRLTAGSQTAVQRVTVAR